MGKVKISRPTNDTSFARCSACRDIYISHKEYSTNIAVAELSNAANSIDGTVSCRGGHVLRTAVQPYQNNIDTGDAQNLWLRTHDRTQLHWSRALVFNLYRRATVATEVPAEVPIVTLELYQRE
jgi:hypothetical protein